MSCIVEKKGSAIWLTMTREKRLNGITVKMYQEMMAGLDRANEDDEIILTVITGAGNYFTAGSDFSPEQVMETQIDESCDTFAPYKLLVDRMIKHKKLLIALVNGPAVGIGVTFLGLCDAVFATESATFWTPFTHLGLCPEACSSYVFPQIMGHQKAAHMILLAEKVTARWAADAGLVTKVFADNEFRAETEKLVAKYSKLAKKSLLVSKRLVRPQWEVENLLSINRREYEVLIGQMNDEETVTRMMSKFGGASKL